MSHDDLYSFDLNGFLVVRDAVPLPLLNAANRVVDGYQARAKLTLHGDRPAGGEKPVYAKRFEAVISEHDVFLQLAMSPAVLSRVVNFVKDPRLKSTWLDFKARLGSIGYHSNHSPYNPVDAYYFQDGRICANLVTVCYALCDIPAEGGALDVIPGSHKANFPLPQNQDALKLLRRRLPLKAGDALVFSHDINHGSCNHLDYVRRCYFTSFSTGSSAHTQGDNGLYDDLFSRAPEGSWQKYLLRRPKGDRDSYPQPAHSVEEEFAEAGSL